MTEWNKLKIPPRQYKYCSPHLQNLTEYFESRTAAYYAEVKTLLKETINERLVRRVDEQGKHPSLAGSKEELVAELYESDYVNFISIYHPPRDSASNIFVKRIWQNDVPAGRAPPVLLQISDLMTIQPRGSLLSSNAFIACINLINTNEQQICKGYDEYNKTTKTIRTRTPSFIAHPNASLEQMMSSKNGDLIAMGFSPTNLPFLFIVPLRLDNAVLAVHTSKRNFLFYCCAKTKDENARRDKADK